MQGLRGATCEPLVSFWVQCHNPECRHEHLFSQDMSYASQANWICPGCDSPLFGNIDLFTLTDNTIVDIAENIFSPSPARVVPPPPPLSDNDLIALASPLFTPSPAKRKAVSDKENVSLDAEPRLREATASDKKPSPSRSIISVSSSDSPYSSSSVFLPPGPHLKITGLHEELRVGEAVFYITFPRNKDVGGHLWVGLIRDRLMGRLRVSRLSAQGQQPSLQGDFTLNVEGSGYYQKSVLNLDEQSLVSPSFPVQQVGRSTTGVYYRLSSEMIDWFESYGWRYRPMRGKGEGFEGLFKRWRPACDREAVKDMMCRLLKVLEFFHSHPFERSTGNF